MKNQQTKAVLLKRMAEIRLELKTLQQKFKEIKKGAKEIIKNAGVRQDSKEIKGVRKKISEL